MRLGIDIGGTKTAALVLDDAGAVVARASAPSGRGNTGTLATAVAVADEAVATAGGWSLVDHVGACMPGLVDPATGIARHASANAPRSPCAGLSWFQSSPSQ